MKKINDLYCKLYVNYNGNIDFLEKFLFEKKLIINNHDFCSENLKIYIIKNHDYYLKDKKGDDFLFYKYIFEIEPLNNIKQNKYIDDLIKILNELKDNNVNFVPSCDYEELLFSY